MKMSLQKAAEIIRSLAEGNALDPDDPDVQNDEALKESAELQAEAFKVFDKHFS